MSSDEPFATAARCGHWRCRLYRFFSVMETGGVIFITNRWPIPCQKVNNLDRIAAMSND